MTAGLGLSAYLDVPQYQRAPHNQEIASLLGLNTTLGATASSQPAGTTALEVVAASGWAVGPAWILDGPVSEVVQVTGSVDGTHVTLAAPGTLFAHNAGVSLSQAGTAGSLAEVILRASAWIEDYCQQGGPAGAYGGDRSLYALARTERWAMPTGRAHSDRDNTIVVMPGHFPVHSVSALSIELGQGQTLALDVSSVEQQTGGRFVEVPYLLLGGPTVGQQLMLETRGLSRAQRQWAVITYTGGIAASDAGGAASGALADVPWSLQQAMVWVVSDLLAQRANPTGAAEVNAGKLHRVHRQRGDMVGDSILLLRAHDILQPYRAEVW
jgi:hypothetical protein